MKAEELLVLIHKKYDGNEHIVLEEIPDGTGTFQRRWIDAAVFGLWPSKGLDRSAFEIKVDRSDFIRELQNPEKHRWVQESFHQFWFVAPIDVIQVEELPNGVGFMYPKGNKLCIKRHCVRNPNPKLDDVLLCGFMRAAWKAIEKNRKTDEKQILESNKDYQRYKLFADCVQQFCSTRDILGFYGDETKELIIHKLEEATEDKKLANEREQILSVLSQFQSEICGLFELFATIANRSLLAKNETGDYVISAYGRSRDDIVPILKSRIKDDYQKRSEELINLILNWRNLPNAVLRK